MGQVPDATTQPSKTVSVGGLSTPYQLSGYSYPVSVTWSNTALTGILSNGAQIILFDGTNYSFFTKARGTFPPALMTNVLQPGQGFFINTTQTVQWVENKPYTWP